MTSDPKSAHTDRKEADVPKSERPTPEQIRQRILNLLFDMDTQDGRPSYHEVDELLDGCVIVHRDNVPRATHASKAYSEGWTDCRNHIFGGDR